MTNWNLRIEELAREVIEFCKLPAGNRGTIIGAMHDLRTELTAEHDKERDQLRDQLRAELDAVKAQNAPLTSPLTAMRKQVEELRAELEEARREHERVQGQLIDERDRFEECVTDSASALGCEEEWSNLHDHVRCIPDLIARLRADNEALRARLGEAMMWLRLVCYEGSLDADEMAKCDTFLASGSSTGEVPQRGIPIPGSLVAAGWHLDKIEPAAPSPAATEPRGDVQDQCNQCGAYRPQGWEDSTCPAPASAVASWKVPLGESAQGTGEANRDSIAEWEKRFGEVPPARFRDLIPLEPLPITENERQRFFAMAPEPPQPAPVERCVPCGGCANESCSGGCPIPLHEFIDDGKKRCDHHDANGEKCGQPRSAAVHDVPSGCGR